MKWDRSRTCIMHTHGLVERGWVITFLHLILEVSYIIDIERFHCKHYIIINYYYGIILTRYNNMQQKGIHTGVYYYYNTACYN